MANIKNDVLNHIKSHPRMDHSGASLSSDLKKLSPEEGSRHLESLLSKKIVHRSDDAMQGKSKLSDWEETHPYTQRHKLGIRYRYGSGHDMTVHGEGRKHGEK